MAAILGICLALLLFAASAWAQQVPNPMAKDGSNATTPVITKQMPSISEDGSPLTARNTTALTAGQILDAAYLLAPAAGARNYDGMRAIALAPLNTTINLVNGLAGYVVSDSVSGGCCGFPATVGLFAAGVARGNGAKVWGVNTQLSDSFGGPVVTAGTGKALVNEFDFNVSAPGTEVLGLQLAGGSVTQPSVAHGIVLQPWTKLGTAPQARWSSFLTSNPGSTDIFAAIGAKAASGSNIKSQDISMAFWNAGGGYGNVILNASADGGLELFSNTQTARALTIYGGEGGSFRVPDKGGFVINSRIVMIGDGASFSVGSDANYTTQSYGNPATATTTIHGAQVVMGGVLVTSTPTLIGSVGALTNGAGSSAGTLTNAPVAGNPTKWVVLNDNGVFRYIPAW